MTSLAQVFLNHRLSEESVSLEDDAPTGDVILGTNQSLFITKDPKDESRRRFRMFIDTFSGTPGPITHQIHNRLLDANYADTLEIRLNNNGGSVAEGLRLINVMDNQFFNRSCVVLEHNALSMAAMVFCKGTERVVYPASRLMFHNYFTVVGGKGGELNDRVGTDDLSRDKMYDHILEKGWMTQDEYKSMLDGKDIWVEFDDLISRGIATHVMDDGDCVPAEEY